MTEELDPKTYPIGKAQNREFTKEVLYQSILMIESAPLRLRQRITTLNEEELELKSGIKNDQKYWNDKRVKEEKEDKKLLQETI